MDLKKLSEVEEENWQEHADRVADAARKTKLAADIRKVADEIRAARAQAAMDNLRRREPVVDDYNAPTSHANQQETEFERYDSVDRPVHYAVQGQLECIEVLEQLGADGHDFRILNAMKYLWRYRHKGGQESLRKAIWYIQRVIDFPNDA